MFRRVIHNPLWHQKGLRINAKITKSQELAWKGTEKQEEVKLPDYLKRYTKVFDEKAST